MPIQPREPDYFTCMREKPESARARRLDRYAFHPI